MRLTKDAQKYVDNMLKGGAAIAICGYDDQDAIAVAETLAKKLGTPWVTADLLEFAVGEICALQTFLEEEGDDEADPVERALDEVEGWDRATIEAMLGIEPVGTERARQLALEWDR